MFLPHYPVLCSPFGRVSGPPCTHPHRLEDPVNTQPNMEVSLKTRGRGLKPNQGERSEGAGGPFGGPTLFNTAMSYWTGVGGVAKGRGVDPAQYSSRTCPHTVFTAISVQTKNTQSCIVCICAPLWLGVSIARGGGGGHNTFTWNGTTAGPSTLELPVLSPVSHCLLS